FGLTLWIGGIGHGSSWYAILMMFFLAASTAKNNVRFRQWFSGALIAVLMLAAGRNLMCLVGTLTGNISAERGQQYAQLTTLRPTPDHPVLVDYAQARY